MLLLTALASIPSYVPTVAQIMASRSAHTEEREARRWRERLRERGGERWEGRAGGGGGETVGAERRSQLHVQRKKEDIEKGKGGADRDNEKGKRREQKASAIRRGRRMRNACAGGRCVLCVWRGACMCVTACMRVSLLARHRLEGLKRNATRQ